MPKAARGHAQPSGVGNRERSAAQLWGQRGFTRHLPMVAEILTPLETSSTGVRSEPELNTWHTAVKSQETRRPLPG